MRYHTVGDQKLVLPCIWVCRNALWFYSVGTSTPESLKGKFHDDSSWSHPYQAIGCGLTRCLHRVSLWGKGWTITLIACLPGIEAVPWCHHPRKKISNYIKLSWAASPVHVVLCPTASCNLSRPCVKVLGQTYMHLMMPLELVWRNPRRLQYCLLGRGKVVSLGGDLVNLCTSDPLLKKLKSA